MARRLPSLPMPPCVKRRRARSRCSQWRRARRGWRERRAWHVVEGVRRWRVTPVAASSVKTSTERIVRAAERAMNATGTTTPERTPESEARVRTPSESAASLLKEASSARRSGNANQRLRLPPTRNPVPGFSGSESRHAAARWALARARRSAFCPGAVRPPRARRTRQWLLPRRCTVAVERSPRSAIAPKSNAPGRCCSPSSPTARTRDMPNGDSPVETG